MDQKLAFFLAEHTIAYTLYEHPAVFTVAEAHEVCKNVPGLACKNLFLKSTGNGATRQYYLMTMPATKRLGIKQLTAQLGVKKLTFASEQELMEILHLTPGSVSPLGLIHDAQHQTIFLVDQEVWDAPSINVHPNINTASVELTHEALEKFIIVVGVHYRVI